VTFWSRPWLLQSNTIAIEGETVEQIVRLRKALTAMDSTPERAPSTVTFGTITA